MMDIHVYGVDLESVIFRGAFAHDTQIPPQASWCGWAISYNSQSHLMFLQGKVNIARYITQVVNTMLLPFLRQEGDVLFQQNKACSHMAAAMQHALLGVQQLPLPARSSDLSPIEQVWDMSRNLLFLQSLPQSLLNCNNGCKMLGTIYHRMTFSSFLTICMREYMPALPLVGGTLCIDVTVWAPLTVTCVFHLV